MVAAPYQFTTGPTTLPDIGQCSYNGCTFGPFYVSNISGKAVEDEARRTIKYMEYVFSIDGYVTLTTGNTSISSQMHNLALLLSAQGGAFTYIGRGFDLKVNPAGGGGVNDVAWGPVPNLLEFQPLGGGLSAKVRWQCTIRIPEVKRQKVTKSAPGGLAAIPLLQFNYETSTRYDEEGFCHFSIKGITEIPMTRIPSQTTRTLKQTVDNIRNIIDTRIMPGIDLDTFRVTDRDFNVSRDKRICTWSIQAEERPYMDIPPNCTVAHGSYDVRPARAGMGFASWFCTLRATYTVRGDKPRRIAWLSFLTLLRHRMAQGDVIPSLKNSNPARNSPPSIWTNIIAGGAIFNTFKTMLKQENKEVDDNGRRSFLIDFSISEGIYLDSKTITFSASWKLQSALNAILINSGIWSKVAETNAAGQNLWAISMSKIQGATSWTLNELDPGLDVVVDFGGG